MDGAYELVDCGSGRRLEQVGPWLLDRPAPGASEPRRDPGAWAAAITYRGGRGWAAVDGGPPPDDETAVSIAGVRLLAGLATRGQVGLFPEHSANAGWLHAAVRRRIDPPVGEPPTVLNLFAYTGLLTLVAARAGAAVTHVDASKPAVAWARRNAVASSLEESPIRWIVDDAAAFVRREARRGRRYAGLVLDPPSYGHGGGEGRTGAFRFEHDIDDLLAACLAVAMPDAFWLVSTHTIGWDARRLGAAVAGGLGVHAREVTEVPLGLDARSGAHLSLGASVRFDPLEPQLR